MIFSTMDSWIQLLIFYILYFKLEIMQVFYKFWIITWRSISYFLNELNPLKETDITNHHQDHTIVR